MRLLACLIVAPQQGYDEPAILSCAISPFCPTSADGLQSEGQGPWALREAHQSCEVAFHACAIDQDRTQDGERYAGGAQSLFCGKLGAAIGVGRARRIGFVNRVIGLRTALLCARIDEAKMRRRMPMLFCGGREFDDRSAMRRFLAVRRSCAKRWGGMRSRPSNQPTSTRQRRHQADHQLAHASGSGIPSDWPNGLDGAGAEAHISGYIF